MRSVWTGLSAANAITAMAMCLGGAGCGGSSKPPMIPDAPDPALGVDAGDVQASAPAAPPVKKK